MAEFHLVDVSARLPELKRRPGVSTWAPTIDASINMTFKTYDEFLESLIDSPFGSGRMDSKMTAEHWPPSNAEQLRLDRWFVLYVI
jgi:multisite-specific tRNA:(cytosine-C5)-methyltransferase